jgi:predicted nuclease with TOPRIM domain
MQSESILDPTHSHLTRFQVKVGTMASPTDSIVAVLAKLEETSRKMDITNSKANEMNRKMEEMQSSIDGVKLEQGAVKEWKPQFKTKVTELQTSVYDLKQKMDMFIQELPKSDLKVGDKGEVLSPAHLGGVATAKAPGQSGHCVPHPH